MRHLTVLLLALLLDELFGEPPSRFHPLVNIGRLAEYLEQQLNLVSLPAPARRYSGTLAVLTLIAPAFLLTALVIMIPFVGYIFEVALLYLCLGNRSLIEHARQVNKALAENNIDEARKSAGLLVSRDTSMLTDVGVIRATVESVLENGNDAVFAPIFWYALLGAPGAVLYRLSNTLDAMWGYKNEQFKEFGWAAARLDDILNFVPARLTALAYGLSGNFSRAWSCWRTQATKWSSSNAGCVMASGAGSLGIQLGGPAVYHGQLDESRPLLGEGNPPVTGDIERAILLLWKGLAIWVTLAAAASLAIWA